MLRNSLRPRLERTSLAYESLQYRKPQTRNVRGFTLTTVSFKCAGKIFAKGNEALLSGDHSYVPDLAKRVQGNMAEK